METLTGPTDGTIACPSRESFHLERDEINLVYAFEPIDKMFPFQRIPCLIIVHHEYEKSSFQTDK